jgi:glycine C-acetyltransferase
MELHEVLERRLATFKHVEATLTFPSGFTANSGVIPTITGERDLIVSDELNHASIIDGVRLSKASRAVFPHRDVDGLEGVLRQARASGGPKGAYERILVITDGVFSMDGDIAPLPDICDVTDRYGAAVMIDDAHASGVLGRNGRGTVDHYGLHGRVDIQVGTLSKAVGVLGGYVAGGQHLRDYLVQRARPFLFSTSQPPAVVAACLAAIDVLETEPERVERLWANTHFFKAGLTGLGFDTGVSETPITPVLVGSSDNAGRLSQRLLELGVFAQAVVFPTVALDRARIRTIVTSEHSRDELQICLDAFASAGRELRLI